LRPDFLPNIDAPHAGNELGICAMTRMNVIVALTLMASVVIMERASGQTSSQGAIPNLGGAAFGWTSMGTDFDAVPGGPQPVGDDPAHPHIGNFQRAQGLQPTFHVADLNNPNLTDFAKQELQKTNEEVFRGKAVYNREARCWPPGVPTYDVNQGFFYFIQTPKEVLMVWHGDHAARHIYMDVPHSQNPKLSWYGESVGHYEGDTLVVDTIGQNTQTFVDNYRTPHSQKLHVIEHFRVINDGKNLKADIFLEDPATFKQPVHVAHSWRRTAAVEHGDRGQSALEEQSCAEAGPGNFAFSTDPERVEPIPTAAKADF
jgi:hypothetical protein